MSTIFRLRLLLDLLGFALFLFGFGYWWLGNGAHEAAGAAFFALLIAHNVFNRRWYAGVAPRAREGRALADIAVTAALGAAMLALLVTSVLISDALSPILSAFGGFTVRQIHTLAAYWALVIVAVHLGLRWRMLMGVARRLAGIREPSRVRTSLLHVTVLVVALLGVRGASELGLGDKLAMRASLDWWNFEESVLGFFAHGAAIVGGIAAATHYAAKLGARSFGASARTRQPR